MNETILHFFVRNLCCKATATQPNFNTPKPPHAKTSSLFNAIFLSILFFILWMICFYRTVPLTWNWFYLILQKILQFLQCGYSRVDGRMYKQMDRIMDRQTVWWTERPINGWTCNIHAKNDDFPIDFAIFTKALPTDRLTDQPTDRRTDQRTDIPSYRDAIAASKNAKIRFFCHDLRMGHVALFCLILCSMN